MCTAMMIGKEMKTHLRCWRMHTDPTSRTAMTTRNRPPNRLRCTAAASTANDGEALQAGADNAARGRAHGARAGADAATAPTAGAGAGAGEAADSARGDASSSANDPHRQDGLCDGASFGNGGPVDGRWCRWTSPTTAGSTRRPSGATSWTGTTAPSRRGTSTWCGQARRVATTPRSSSVATWRAGPASGRRSAGTASK